MIRKIKFLGLAVVASLALGAIGSSSAMAAVEFHSDAANTIFTGETNVGAGIGTTHVFTAADSTITCRKANFTGTQAGSTAAEIFAEASYNECKVHIGGFELGTTVNMNNCRYTFAANGTAAVVDKTGVDCTASPITYRVSNFLGECDVKVGESGNSALKTVSYDGASTSSATADVTVTPNITGISGSASGNLCTTTGAFTNGTYTGGATTVKGFVDNAGAEGAQTAIWVA